LFFDDAEIKKKEEKLCE